jgi:hypothetical protein
LPCRSKYFAYRRDILPRLFRFRIEIMAILSRNRHKLLVVSNNPLVWKEAGENCRRVDGTALRVLYACLGLVGEETHALYAHPIAGNARLLHNPYRSVVLEEKKASSGGREETRGNIRLLEYFAAKLESLDGEVPAAALDDYRLIDYELFLATFPRGEPFPGAEGEKKSRPSVSQRRS